MNETITIELTQQEVNVLLQMLDKTPVTGIPAMRTVVVIDHKIRQKVAELGQPVEPEEE
jgi:ABC-type uncharacterized transport system ATPase subunit